MSQEMSAHGEFDAKKTFLRAALRTKHKKIDEAVPIVPFGDWDYYYTERRLIWKSDNNPKLVVDVPEKFVTDLASIPRVFWTILPKTADYTYPAIFHDYLYWYQPDGYDRERADFILKAVMEELHVNKLKIALIFRAVRLFGNNSWSSNKFARENGERRILKTLPNNPMIKWSDWKNNPDNFE